MKEKIVIKVIGEPVQYSQYYLGQKNRIMNIGHNGMKKTKKNFVQR